MLFEDAFGVKAILIVELPLQGIAEHLIRFRNELEVILRRAVTRIDIRVIPPGKPSKCFLDIVFGSCTNDFQDDVKIARGAHSAPCLLLLLAISFIGIDVLGIDNIAISPIRLGLAAASARAAFGSAARLLACAFVHGLEDFV